MRPENSNPRIADAGTWARLRQPICRLGRLARPSRLRFVLVFAAALILAYNFPFWRGSVAAVGASFGGLAFLAAVAATLIAIHALLLLLVPGRRLPAVLAAALLIFASIVLFYEVTFNVYVDKVMVRNVFETTPPKSATC